ncbi:MAG: MMPL family transporter, partial [Planctomycetaceae bacterium]
MPRDEAIQRLQGVLVGPGYLKIRLSAAGRSHRDLVVERLTKLADSQLGIALLIDDQTSALSEALLDEPEQSDAEDDESTADESATSAEAAVYDFQVHWPTMHVEQSRIGSMIALATKLRLPFQANDGAGAPVIEACFLEPGWPVALSVELTEAGSADRGAAFRAIYETAESVGIPQDALHLGGRPVAGHALNQAVKRSAWNRDPSLAPTQFYRKSVILTSVGVGIVLAFLMLQSVRLATLVIISSIYTMFVAVSLVPITGGSMNMVLVVMPTLLMVLTMSAGIHVANYWRHAAFENPKTAVDNAFRMAKTPCLLAAVTTSIGLVSLATSPLVPVREFGLYSAAGCLLSLLVILFALPAMLQMWPGRPPTTQQVQRTSWKAFGRFIAHRHLAITVICIGGCIACSLGLRHFRTETKVIRYFADDSRVVQDYNFLENNLAGIIPVNAVIRFDEESQSRLNFLQRMEIVRRVQNRIGDHTDVSGTLSLADFQPQRDPPDLTSLSGPRRLLEMKKYNTRARKTEQAVHASTDRVRSFVTVAKEAASLQVAGDNKLNQAGDELWNVTAQVAIMSDLDYGQLTSDLDQRIQSELKLTPGANHRVTGMIPLFLRTQQAVLDSLLLSFGLAFAVIAIV